MSRPTVELSMIVNRGGTSLDRCLRSVAPLVDRITVGDTGSGNDTAAVARSHGAVCVPVTLTDNFASARNQVLQAACCDWILVLDADEMLHTSEAASLLPNLLQDPGVDAYTLERWDYVIPGDNALVAAKARPNPGVVPEAKAYPAYLRSYHTRLFRRRPDVFYRERVHEQVTSQIDLLGLTRAAAPLLIHHFGYVETPVSEQQEKIERYRRLALLKATEEPEDYEAQLQIGITELFEWNSPERALPFLRRTLTLRPSDSRGWLYSGICLRRLVRLDEAKRHLLQAWQLGERTTALYDAMGDVYLLSADYDQAFGAYLRAYGAGMLSNVAYAKIGLAEVHLGKTARGLARIRQALKSEAANPALLDLLQLSESTAALLNAS